MNKARKYRFETYTEDISDYEDIYDPEEMEVLLEDDEISSEEEGFMIGYMGY